MAVKMWGQMAIQATMPQEDPIQVGSQWVDTSSTPVLRLCTSISPYTFAAISGGAVAPTEQSTALTGTQNNFDLTSGNNTLRCTAASAVVFTGFTVAGITPTAGATVTIINAGSSTVRVAKEDAGSTAANRATSPSAAGQIVGVGGVIKLVYDDTTDRWRVVGVECGAPVAVAYGAGNFTGDGTITWSVDSGDVIANAFTQDGTKVTLFLSVSTSTLGGTTSNAVRMTLPNGFTVANNGVQVGIFGRYLDTGATFFTMIYVANSAASTILTFGPLSGANLTLGTNTFYIQGLALFLVD